MVDASTVLTDADYFLIDDHMRGSGHAKIARLLADAVQGDDRWRVRPAANRMSPDEPADGAVERRQHVGDVAIIGGWAARRDTGEPPQRRRCGKRPAPPRRGSSRHEEGRPVAAPGKPAAVVSGFALAAAADRLGDGNDLEITSTWADGHIARLRDAMHGPGQ